MIRVGLLSIACAVAVVFGPALPYLGDAALGGSGSDALKHVWSQWWVVQHVVQDGAIPMETALVHHPVGGAFFSLDTINALIGLPLRAVFDPVATYNLVLMVDLAAAAAAMMMLAHKVVSNRWAAALAGVGFAFSAWTLTFSVASGVSETALFFPIPLVLLLAIRTGTQPGWWAPALGGALLVVQGLACWSHGITTGLLLGILGIAWLWTRPWRPGSTPRLDRACMLRFGCMALCALAIALPAYLAISDTVSGEAVVKARHLSVFPNGMFSPLDVPEANAFGLVDFILPTSLGLRASIAGTDRLLYAAYPGLVLLCLAGVGLRHRTQRTRWLAVGVVVFVLLAMGPRLYLDHDRSWPGLANPVYLAAYWGIPLVNATIHSVDRFAIGVQLCIALLAAIGTERLLARRPVRWVGPALVGAVLAEVVLLSPTPWPIPMVRAEIHPATQKLSQMPGTGAVIDLPFLVADEDHAWFSGDIFLQQTAHQRPIPYQLEGVGVETASPPLRANPFFDQVSATLIHGHPPPASCDGVRGLANLGFRWIVWQPALAPPQTRDEVSRTLSHCMDQRQEIGDRTIYTIPG